MCVNIRNTQQRPTMTAAATTVAAEAPRGQPPAWHRNDPSHLQGVLDPVESAGRVRHSGRSRGVHPRVRPQQLGVVRPVVGLPPLLAPEKRHMKRDASQTNEKSFRVTFEGEWWLAGSANMYICVFFN